MFPRNLAIAILSLIFSMSPAIAASTVQDMNTTRTDSQPSKPIMEPTVPAGDKGKLPNPNEVPGTLRPATGSGTGSGSDDENKVIELRKKPLGASIEGRGLPIQQIITIVPAPPNIKAGLQIGEGPTKKGAVEMPKQQRAAATEYKTITDNGRIYVYPSGTELPKEQPLEPIDIFDNTTMGTTMGKIEKIFNENQAEWKRQIKIAKEELEKMELQQKQREAAQDHKLTPKQVSDILAKNVSYWLGVATQKARTPAGDEAWKKYLEALEDQRAWNETGKLSRP